MNRSVFLFLALLFFAFSALAEKIVVSQVLVTEPLPVSKPIFSDVENVEGKTFSDSDLLSFQHFEMSDLFPVENDKLKWFDGRKTLWNKSFTDEDGFIFFNKDDDDGASIAYIASYINSDRWVKAKLDVRSPAMLEVFVNGKSLGKKTTKENEEGTIGKFSQDITLTKGTHLLIIKAFNPGKLELDWKVSATLDLKEDFANTDISLSLSPSNIKNINHILDGVKITATQASPDGRFYSISYRQSQPPTNNSETWTEVRRFSDNALVHTFRHARLSRFAWHPKKNEISYTSTHDNKSTLYSHNVETGELKTLLKDLEKLASITWAPCGKFLIYGIREDGKGADANIRQVLGMQDRQSGWRNRTFLYKYDIETGLSTRLTYGNLTTSLQDISPDSKQLLISTSRPDYTERPYSKTNLMLVNLETFVVDTLLHDQRWAVSASFSPDGKKLLATGGPNAFDGAGVNVPEGTIPNNYDRQAYIYDIASREVSSITKNFDPSVSSVHWHPTNNTIYLHVVEEDFQRLYSYDHTRNTFRRIETGVDMISNINFSNNSPTATFNGSNINAPAKSYSINLRTNKVDVLADTESFNYRHVEFGKTANWDFVTSTDVNVKGRYYLPPDFDPEKKYPVIVYYYAGTTPVGRTFGGRYPFNLWAGNGYVVYVLQPSGAIGFGQEFSAAHVNNWGITVADEIIESTKAFLEAHPFTNSERVGCAGASYGGFMTMLLMTRTDMFATAISHAGISSISSYWGEGFWGYAYSAEATAESFPWNNPEIYVGQSPLFSADKINTPLLLLTGDSDTNVPPGESIQLYTALKILDRPVELVLVKGEDHHIANYNRRIEWHNTIMAWWDKHLKNQPQWWDDLYPKKNF
jgi:dipeptidyl aminopeptidase/acylaminoacyl peptidase